MRKYTQEEFINDCNKKHNNRYDYSKTIYTSSREKVIITCNIHGDFEQLAYEHKAGSGCRKCGTDVTKSKTSLSLDNFIQKAVTIHGNKFNYSKVNLINNLTEIEIICPTHGSFMQVPKSHIKSKYGCPACAADVISKKYSKGIDKFIEEATEVYGEQHDYSKVDYKNTDTLITIICKKHNVEFECTPYNYLIGYGCYICARLDDSITKVPELKSTQEFINLCNIIHENKFNYNNVEFKGTHEYVEITCNYHNHTFQQIPIQHIRGNGGCVKCKGEDIRASKIMSQDEFINRCIEIHCDKYDYSLVDYKATYNYVIIICKEHGEFKQRAKNHLIGNGCPTCALSNKSKIATEWLNSLNIPDLIHEYPIPGTRLRVDGYDPNNKICYEFHGDYWHGNIQKFDPQDFNEQVQKTYGQLYQETIDRTKLLKSIGYNIVEIWESEWNELKKTI